jgi:hypothetical protein
MKNLVLLIFILCFSENFAFNNSLVYIHFETDSSQIDTTSIISKGDLGAADSTADSTLINKDTINTPLSEPYLDCHLESRFITSDRILKYDYRSTENILELLPSSFLQNLGSAGQPSELLLYGLGNGNISHSLNGLQINNRWKNSIDLHYIQSESFDSLEYIPLTSGFLYNVLNNPVHINYLQRKQVTNRPFSRLRFYQASYEEGFLDLLFNAPIFKNTYLYVEATNSAADPRIQQNDLDYNTDFSLWNVESRLKYLLDDKISLEARYNHVKNNVELNGGVEEAPGMFNVNEAVVIYPDRKQRITRHDFSLSINAEFIPGSPTFITGYYQFNFQEFYQNTKNTLSNVTTFKHDNKYKSYGLNVRQILRYSIFDLDLFGNYEHTDYKTDLFGNLAGDNILSAASRITLNLFDVIRPSFFIKTSNYRKVQFNGFGAEGEIDLTKSLRLFGGISFVEKPFSVLEDRFMGGSVNINKQKLNLLELIIEYDESFLKGSAGYFYYKNDNAPLPFLDRSNDSLLVNEISYFDTDAAERTGINISCSFKFWKLLLTNNSAYYFDNSSNKNNSLPEFSASGGIYYIDTLFQNNLYLKAGINYKLTGAKSFVTYDFEKSLPIAYYVSSNNSSPVFINSGLIPVSKQFDLFVAGTIQKYATVYIVFENLLSENYYIQPYYPLYPAGFRFGITWEFFD